MRPCRLYPPPWPKRCTTPAWPPRRGTSAPTPPTGWDFSVLPLSRRARLTIATLRREGAGGRGAGADAARPHTREDFLLPTARPRRQQSRPSPPAQHSHTTNSTLARRPDRQTPSRRPARSPFPSRSEFPAHPPSPLRRVTTSTTATTTTTITPRCHLVMLMVMAMTKTKMTRAACARQQPARCCRTPAPCA